MLIGYARVSTHEQNIDMQMAALENAGCERIFSENATGAKTHRPQLTAALEYLRFGDALVVWRLDRLARSTKDLIAIMGTLAERGIALISLTEAIDTTTASGRLVFHIFAALAEFERGIIRERTFAGLEAARRRGARGGRPKALTNADVIALNALLNERALTVKEVAKRMNVSVSTIYNYTSKSKEE